MTARGFTWSEQHRHECEVRHVAGLSTKAQRAAYFDGLEKWRGPDAVARLRADVSAAWYAARGEAAPLPPGQRPAAGASASVRLGVNPGAHQDGAGDGSFLAPPREGSLRRGEGVESGAAA